MNKLYTKLMALCDDDDTPFFFSDQELQDDEHYRIFSYHFTDKESWLLPGALECRGVMFEVTADGEYIRIASRTMQKFFNHNSRTGEGEVDFIEYGKPHYVMNKADGSLISSYLDNNHCVMLKSKGSITSDYANLAMELMDDNIDLYDFVLDCEVRGYTVNMELVSPDPKFRIVLHYAEPQLIVLNVRHREDGLYMDSGQIPQDLFCGTVGCDALNHLDTVKNLEGYVVIDENGNWWKAKSAWYLSRHKAKDYINQPLAFALLVLKEEADDIFELVTDQPEILAEMKASQHKIVTIANRYINSITKYWLVNNHLSRKDYAIKGKEELDWVEFTLAMKYYSFGDEPDWSAFFAKQVKKIDWEIE